MNEPDEIRYCDPSQSTPLLTVREVYYKPRGEGMKPVRHVRITRLRVHAVHYGHPLRRITESTGIQGGHTWGSEEERRADVALIQRRLEVAAENKRLRERIAELSYLSADGEGRR